MDELKYGDLCCILWRSNNFRFRQGSVPGIHKRYRGGWRAYKAPPHRFEEANKYIADEDDQVILTPHQVSQVKKYHWVPDPWDDVPRARQGDTWKNYRKTQYKPR